MTAFAASSTSVSKSAGPGLSGRGGASGLIDAPTLMRIKTLEMRAKVVVRGFWSGINRSPQHGFSAEFSEYRQYSPGDDPRYLDWKLYARSDRYYIKRFEDETNLACQLVIDQSRSMSYGSVGYTKAAYAATLAATLAYFLAMQRDAVGLLTFSEDVTDFIPPRYRAGHLHRLLCSLERTPDGNATDLDLPLTRIVQHLKRRGVIVLISDLLAPLAGFEENLSYLRTLGHEVIVLHLLDPAEMQFPFTEAAVFYDLENQRELNIDPAAIRADYTAKLTAHLQQIEAICARFGLDYHRQTTDQPLEWVLFEFLRRRLQKTPRGRPG